MTIQNIINACFAICITLLMYQNNELRKEANIADINQLSFNEVEGIISKNQAELSQLKQSLLALTENLESIYKYNDSVDKITLSYKNSLLNLSNRVDTMENFAFEIHKILKDLDEQLIDN